MGERLRAAERQGALATPGELGPLGRTACGEPRQGTRLSETYADTAPSPPDTLCPRCTAKTPTGEPNF